MKTKKRVNVNFEFCELIPENCKANTIYVSGKYRTVTHECLCGSGVNVVTPLDDKTGWKLTTGRMNSYSMTPSILNIHCPNKCHYIITNSVANMI